MRRRGWVVASVLGVMTLAITACGGSESSAGSSAVGADGKGRTITVGVLTSFSGAFSGGFHLAQDGVDARLKSYAAAGGKCSGVSIQTVQGDDASSAQGALSAVQKLTQRDDAFAILNASAFLFGASQFLTTTAKDTPVLGPALDGAPQWYDLNVHNFFPAQPLDNFHDVWSTRGEFLKAAGATRVAGVAVDNPAAAQSIEATNIAVTSAGLAVGYVNEKVPIGSTDVGAVVLGIKESGADALAISSTPETAFAISAGLQQAGVRMKSILSFTGYGGDLLGSPAAVAEGQGVSFQVPYAPVELQTEATKTLQSALKQYGGSASGIPTFAQGQGWLAAELLIHALEGAGCNATQGQILDFLNKDTTYNGGGLLPSPIDFSKRATGGECFFVTTLQGNAFVPDERAKPICGKQTGQSVKGF